ncbi:YceH family protein [Shewanella sp. 30m-9]
MELTPHEARIIGVLLEKEITTPEQYPLSLNSLTSGCNQKTSRDPVLDLSESEVQNTLDNLTKKRLISEQSGFGSRVVKYKHRFCNTEFSDLQLKSSELAVICLLLLRGPQTPGELRTRSNRLHEFHDVSEVEATLNELQRRESPLVMLLAKEPGKREARYRQLFTEANDSELHSQPSQNADHAIIQQNSGLETRVNILEQEVIELKALLKQLLDK